MGFITSEASDGTNLDVVGVLVIIGGVEDDLVGGLSVDVTGRNGSHGSGAGAKQKSRSERASGAVDEAKTKMMSSSFHRSPFIPFRRVNFFAT